MCTNQSLCVKWDTVISRKLSVRNGVKQGGILSPIMFTVLKKAKLGCHIGDLFMGALGYADDVVIIAPTVCSLKSMLRICDDFGKEFHVKFNSNKYQLLHYPCTTNATVDNLIYDNYLIKCQSIATHLGHTIGPAAKTKAIEDGVDKFIVALNGIIATFKDAYCDVKYKLIKTYCMSLYGCVLWNLGSKSMSDFYVTWRKTIRKLLRLPLRTHSKYLPLICDDLLIVYSCLKG